MSNHFRKHPIFNNKDQIVEICSPLKKLDITYFSHATVNQNGEFSGICNNPEFAEHYLRKKYYNADIHLFADKLGNYIIWDMLQQYGVTEQMTQEASQFGVNHTFTIVKKHEKSCDYYHFATHSNQDGFNQVYLSNLDVLDRFIEYFHEKIRQSKMLLIAYDYTFEHKQEILKPSLQDLDNFLNLEKKGGEVKSALGSEINPALGRSVIHKETGKILSLAPQQARCLALLLSGKSSKEIGLALNLSYRSVEHYIERIRKILDCRNSKEVMAQYSLYGTQGESEGGR